MKFRWLLLFLLIFGFESYREFRLEGDRPPQIGDAAEVHNIAYSLAHGRGYSFDWNDEQWRKLWQGHNADGRFDFVVVRRGSYPTMFRPPLMPILVGAILELFPHDSFLAWRIFDSAVFAAAACLLCDVAFIHGGIIGMIAMLAILISDPLRRAYIPGWWTEGLAFASLSLIVWLISNGDKLRPLLYNICAGLAVGLLCLDRSIFTLALPFAWLTLVFARSKPKADLINNALIIVAVSILIQIPWWVRNVELSRRLMPLGTQGGFNLPDEYGDVALGTGGLWTGRGIRDAWIPPSEAALRIPIPPGFSKESFQKLWTPDANDDPNDRRFAAMLYAAVCNSLQSEIAISDVGKRAAISWARANYTKLPTLMAKKTLTLTNSKRSYLTLASLLSVTAFFGLPKLRRIFFCLLLLIFSYVLAIALTHVVYGRFLLPILPPLYVGMALGTTSIVRLASRRLPSLI